MSGEGATEFCDIEGGGIGEGEGVKDVSDQIESEDQVCSKLNFLVFSYVSCKLKLFTYAVTELTEYYPFVIFFISCYYCKYRNILLVTNAIVGCIENNV